MAIVANRARPVAVECPVATVRSDNVRGASKMAVERRLVESDTTNCTEAAFCDTRSAEPLQYAGIRTVVDGAPREWSPQVLMHGQGLFC